MSAANYREFLASKAQLESDSGFEPVWIPDFLFDFQKALTDWAIRKGRPAILAACGLGKTAIELVYAENILRRKNKSVLILTPLAVSSQTVREGEKFGIEAHRSNGGTPARPSIVVTNYEKLHLFNPDDFAGVICDESGILKNFDGTRKAQITEFMRTSPFRMACTATPAPNDYIELGTTSEALGYLGYMDMLSKFFKNDQNSNHPNRLWAAGAKWRFRGHAERDFWRWVCSWARAIQKPSDMGFADNDFLLPALLTREHIVSATIKRTDRLFDLPAITLEEQRDERRRTLRERCELAAELVSGTGKPAVVWCHLNPEGDLLESMIPDSVQVSGSDSDNEKEEKFLAFVSGQARVIVSKPRLAGFGLNWQHCAHQTFFPSHSFEEFHQGIRRSWRFGQKNPVTIDVIASEGERGVLSNLQRKAEAAEIMFERLVATMNDALAIQRASQFKLAEVVPSWL